MLSLSLRSGIASFRHISRRPSYALGVIRQYADNEKPSEAKVKEKLPPLPMLQRPLGVSSPPEAHAQTLDERAKEIIFDDDKRMEQREHLVKQAGKAYYQDIHMLRYYGGKTWIAQKALIREDRALYFPNIFGSRLSDGEKVHTTDICKGKVSVIAMLSTQVSQHHVESFTNRINEKYRSHPAYQYMQINLQENILKSFLVSLFLSSLRGSIPEHFHPTYILSRQNMEYLREPLGMTNSRIGYVYLVDEDLRVRWAGCADATPEEQDGLMLSATVLLRRHEKMQKEKMLAEGKLASSR